MKKKITLNKQTVLALNELSVKIVGAYFTEPPADICPGNDSLTC